MKLLTIRKRIALSTLLAAVVAVSACAGPAKRSTFGCDNNLAESGSERCNPSAAPGGARRDIRAREER